MLSSKDTSILSYLFLPFLLLTNYDLSNCTEHDSKNITIGVMISSKGPKPLGQEAVAAVDLSLQNINTSPDFEFARSLGYQFQILLDDVPCEPSDAFAEMMDIFTRTGSHVSELVQDAFVGPSCDEICQPGGRLAKYYDLMMISYGCESSIFDDKDEYPTFGRTTPTFREMEIFFSEVINHYQWPRVTVVTMSTPVWQETLTEFETQLSVRGINVRRWSLLSVPFIQTSEFHNQLLDEANNTRVFLFLMYSDGVIRFMQQAHKAGLRNGEFVFLAVDFAGTHKRIREFGNVTYLDGLLDVTYDVQPESVEYQAFLSTILGPNWGNVSHCDNYEIGIHPLLISDGMFVIAGVFNLSLSMGIPIRHGAEVANLTHRATFNGRPKGLGQLLYNMSIPNTFKGLVQEIKIGEAGTRTPRFMLHNIQDGCYVPIARTKPGGKGLQFLKDQVVWPGGGATPPTGQLKCGWLNELCADEESNIPVIVGSTVGVVLLLLCVTIGILGYCFYTRKIRELHLMSTEWLKEWDDIRWRIVDPFVNPGLATVYTSKSAESLASVRSDNSATTGFTSRQTTATSFHCPVVRMDVEGTWTLKEIRKGNVQLTEAVKRELNLIRSLKHPNINAFIGACIKPDHVYMMWMYNPKGSLMDVIYSGIFKMELMFQLSFAQDIAKGLAFLHNSELHVHGRLKSSNIVVDSALTCKLTDIYTPKFREGERELSESDPDYWFQHVWTAPERLRSPSMAATQKSDLYSYGIILYEIMVKRRPYLSEEQVRLGTEPDWEEVITCVRDPDKFLGSSLWRKDSIYTISEDNAGKGEGNSGGSFRLYRKNTDLRRGSRGGLDNLMSPTHRLSYRASRRSLAMSATITPPPAAEMDSLDTYSHWSSNCQSVRQLNQRNSSRNSNCSINALQQSNPGKHPTNQVVPRVVLSPDTKETESHRHTTRAPTESWQSLSTDNLNALRPRAHSSTIQNRGSSSEQLLQQPHRHFESRDPNLRHSSQRRQEKVTFSEQSQSTVQKMHSHPPASTPQSVQQNEVTPSEQNTRRSKDKNFPSDLKTGGENDSPGHLDTEPQLRHHQQQLQQGMQQQQLPQHEQVDNPAHGFKESNGNTLNANSYLVRFKSSGHVNDLSDGTPASPVANRSHPRPLCHSCGLCCVSQIVEPQTPDPVVVIKTPNDNVPSPRSSLTSPVSKPVCRPELPSPRQLYHHWRSNSYDLSGRRSTDTVVSHDMFRSKGSVSREPRSSDPGTVGLDKELKMLQLMRQCWEETPEYRPSSDTIIKKLRALTGGRSLSDNIEQIMTRYSEQLEDTVHERTRRLEEEKAKYFRVLCEVIPQKYVGTLVSGAKVEAESFSNVSIFFSDIVGFTSICGKCSPQEVLDFLNELYTRFDVVLNSYKVYKVETIGDAYMVAAGIPEPIPDHAQQIAYMALHLLSVSVEVKAPYVDSHGNRIKRCLRLRIGLNSGPVVAGIVGEKMPRYCLYGNTVNIASRMESNGKPLRIHMSREITKELEVIGGFYISYRGRISVKGKDNPVPTYWLLNSKLHPFDLPDWTRCSDAESPHLDTESPHPDANSPRIDTDV